MKKIILSMTALTAVFLLAAGTASAQEKKNIQKTVKIVTVEENGVTKDTTIVTVDTLDAAEGTFVFETKEGQMVHGTSDGKNVIIMRKAQGMPCGPEGPVGPHMKVMGFPLEQQDGVNYTVSIDGVTVNIVAPNEKSAQADQILAEVRKILKTK